MAGLRTISWLNELDDDEVAALEARSTRLKRERGATVFAPTPAPRSVYLLEQGSVRILRLSQGGDEVTLGYIVAGEVFGELPGFGDHPRESFAVAREPSVAWRIPLVVFREWIATRPPIAAEVTRQMGERMKRVEARVETFVFGDVRARLAMVLLELAHDFGQADGNRCVIDLALSQAEIATLIGATRQSVNAAMSGLKEEGLLRVAGSRSEILDLAELRRIGKSSRR